MFRENGVYQVLYSLRHESEAPNASTYTSVVGIDICRSGTAAVIVSVRLGANLGLTSDMRDLNREAG